MTLARLVRCWPAFTLVATLSAADDAIDKLGRLTAEWVRTRSETVRIETEWSGQRDLVSAMTRATEERARMAEETVAQIEARTAQERGELATLESRNELSAKNLAAAEARVARLADGVLALRPTLPPRLQAALELPYKSLADANLPVADRMQHLVTILSRCGQFNRLVTAGEEVLALDGGPARSVDVVYFGLSHAYALDRAAGRAWLGEPGPESWRWEPQPGALAAVTRLVAVAADKADPEFVIAPAHLVHVIP